MNFDSTRVKIDLDAISDNFDAIAAKTKVPVMAVEKEPQLVKVLLIPDSKGCWNWVFRQTKSEKTGRRS